MALDEGGGAAQPSRKKKKRKSPVVVGEQAYGGSKVPSKPPSRPPSRPPVVQGEQAGGVSKAAPSAPVVMGEQAAGGAKTPYVPPRPQVFDRAGIPGSIFDVNRRVEVAAAAFASNFGFQPSPGLLLDIVRGPLADEELESLFNSVPQTFAQARARAVSADEGVPGDLATRPVMQGLKEAIERDSPGTSTNFDAYVKANAAELNAIQEEDPAQFEFVVESFQKARSTEQGQPTLQLAGPGTEPRYPWILLPFRAAAQVSEALVYAPAGLYEVGKALGLDVAEARLGDYSFERSRKVGKQVVEGVKETYSDPMANPGFIFLDVFGALSGGAGAVARVSRATRARTLKEAGRALSRRGVPERVEVGGEDFYLSQNVAVAVVQKALYRRREKKLQKRRQGPPRASAGVRHPVGFLTTEAAVGRSAKARQKVEKDLAMEPVREVRAMAGMAHNTARAFQKMPRRTRRKLTRGEQKAIGVLFTDEGGTWQEKLAFHRGFHNRMIDEGVGDPKVHQRQLEDLKLAEKALQENRPIFQKAVALADEVSTEGQLMKVAALGLDPAGAQARIANYANIMRGEGIVEGAVPRTTTARYVPSVVRGTASRSVGRVIGALRAGLFGHPAHRNLPELTHHFTGESIRVGDVRIDTANLIGESYARAVSLAFKKKEHARLWEQATDRRMSAWDEPIRSWESIPDELRMIKEADYDGAPLTAEDLKVLDEKGTKALMQHLYPETAVEGVKWVDSRLLGDAWRYPNEPNGIIKFVSALNEGVRIPTLFLRLAYGVGNVLGNTSMLLMQSLGAPNNLRKAYQINKRIGEKNARSVAALVGEGKSLSFSPEDLVQTKISRTIAHAWSALVDRKFREASFFHWAERFGYKDEADITRLLDVKAEDTKILKDRVEIVRRAKKDMVEFDNQTHHERNTMRHVVFVYPWVSRSIIWSIRTMVEHPLKTWTLAELGKIGEEEAEKAIGELVPDWVRNNGYFPLFTDDKGVPQIVNPSSFNNFSGLNELRNATTALFTDQPYGGPEEYNSPALDFMIREITGRNDFGTEYKHRLYGPVLELLEDLPQASAVKKALGKEEKVDPDAPPSERPSFIKNDWLDYVGPLVVGGLFPRTPDQEALVADWLRDLPKEERYVRTAAERKKMILDRLAVERRAIWQAEQATAHILGRNLPTEVRDAIELQMRFADAYARAALEGTPEELAAKSDSPQNLGIGRQLTALERRVVQIKTLGELGRIDADTQQDLNKAAHRAAKKDDIRAWGAQFDKDYLHAEALSRWWDDRDDVLDFASNADEYMRDLRKAGLYKGGSGKHTTEDLYKVGQQFVDYQRQSRARAEDTGARSDLVTLDNSLDRAWIDEQDKPITVDGKTFPSPVRVAWAMKAQDEQLADIAEMATASWDTLSNFDKEILGRRPADKASYGWVVLNATMDGYRGNLTPEDVPKELREHIPEALPSNQRTISKEHKILLAKWVDKNFAPGFYKDFLFSLEPKHRRLRVLPIITQSKEANLWKDIFREAEGQFKLIERSRNRDYDVNYTITGVRESWDSYVKDTLYPYLQENTSDRFNKELELLGGVDLLRTLIAD